MTCGDFFLRHEPALYEMSFLYGLKGRRRTGDFRLDIDASTEELRIVTETSIPSTNMTEKCQLHVSQADLQPLFFTSEIRFPDSVTVVSGTYRSGKLQATVTVGTHVRSVELDIPRPYYDNASIWCLARAAIRGFAVPRTFCVVNHLSATYAAAYLELCEERTIHIGDYDQMVKCIQITFPGLANMPAQNIYLRAVSPETVLRHTAGPQVFEMRNYE